MPFYSQCKIARLLRNIDSQCVGKRWTILVSMLRRLKPDTVSPLHIPSHPPQNNSYSKQIQWINVDTFFKLMLHSHEIEVYPPSKKA